MKTELVLEGLACANCAMKIEKKVKELSDVNTASVNFVTKILTIETDQTNSLNNIISAAKDIVKAIEPDVIVKEKTLIRHSYRTLLLEGLDCANCATKIEGKVRDISGIKSASVDFVSKKMVYEVNSDKEADFILEEIKEVVHKLEPDVEIIDMSLEKAGNLTDDREHDNNHSHSYDNSSNKREFIQFAIGGFLFALAFAFKNHFYLQVGLFAISYIIVGGEVVLKAVKNILRGQVFDENFLMAIASLGAFSIKQFPEGVAVMLFYQLGELFQGIAVNHSRKSISSLMNIRPDFANIKLTDGTEKKVSPDTVSIGDIIIVKPGEKIPLDGTVIEGTSLLDTSALTGESLPREVEIGSQVLSGSINKSGLITIKVEKEFGESTVSKILDLVQNAGSKKAPTENFITKFARIYTPTVVFIALGLAIIPPLFIQNAKFSDWLYRALVFLVNSCPCALVVSIPLGFLGGIGGASKKGILVKGGNYLEALNNVETIVFDKTGTLTKGVFTVTEVSPQNGFSKDELVEFASFAECYSSHPIAVSILNSYGKEIDKKNIGDYEDIPGHGIKVVVNGTEILAGNAKLMNAKKIFYTNINVIGTIVHVAVNKNYAGYIVISDTPKEDASEAIKDLKRLGVKKVVMLTGDNKQAAKKIADQLGVDEVHAELLPNQKVEKLELLDKEKSPKGKLIFVGDGINDAPVLARADVGIAMGGVGSDSAIEASDVVLMTDEPSKIVTAIKIAKKTRKVVWQNIFFAFAVKLIVLILGAGGLATMWEAVFADVGVAIIAIINAMRVMNTRNI